jgi:hypothetical protein
MKWLQDIAERRDVRELTILNDTFRLMTGESLAGIYLFSLLGRSSMMTNAGIGDIFVQNDVNRDHVKFELCLLRGLRDARKNAGIVEVSSVQVLLFTNRCSMKPYGNPLYECGLAMWHQLWRGWPYLGAMEQYLRAQHGVPSIRGQGIIPESFDWREGAPLYGKLPAPAEM